MITIHVTFFGFYLISSLALIIGNLVYCFLQRDLTLTLNLLLFAYLFAAFAVNFLISYIIV